MTKSMKKISITETVEMVGKEVELYGWVDTKRDHKKIVFIDLRDRTGTVQVVGGEEFKALFASLAQSLIKNGKIEIISEDKYLIFNE